MRIGVVLPDFTEGLNMAISAIHQGNEALQNPYTQAQTQTNGQNPGPKLNAVAGESRETTTAEHSETPAANAAENNAGREQGNRQNTAYNTPAGETGTRLSVYA